MKTAPTVKKKLTTLQKRQRLFERTKKLSVLLRIAYEDMYWVEKNSNYTVDMYHWHDAKSYSGPCVVCAAGAVMSRTLRREIESAPTGIVMRGLLDDQITLITSLPTEAAQRVHASSAAFEAT